MMPTSPSPESNGTQEARPVAVPEPVYRWYHKLSAVVMVSFAVYIGLFLMVFPWTDYWDINYFSQVVPQWHVYWGSSYARGAVSGLGLINLYFGLMEVFRLRRFAKRH